MLSPLRQICSVSLALFVVLESVSAGQSEPIKTRTILKDLPVEVPLTVKSIGSAAERLGRFARVPLGVEDSTTPVPSSGSQPASLALTGMKVQDALDSLSRFSTNYEWRQIANVVVLRPVDAWQDSANPLHRRIESVEWRGITFADALDKTMSLLSGTAYKTPQPTPDRRRFDVTLHRANLLQLLNTIVLEHGELVWHVGYKNGDPREQFGIGFMTFAGHARWLWIPTFEKTAARSAGPASRDLAGF